jgi:hypothetical protein
MSRTKKAVASIGVVALAALGIGVGLAQGASTPAPTSSGTTTCAGAVPTYSVSGDTLSWKCPVATTTTTTTPPSTTTTTAVPPTTTTTQATSCPDGKTTGADYASGGTLGPFSDPNDINNSNGYNTYVAQDGFWTSQDSGTLCVTSPSKWTDTVDFGPPGDGAVQGYPDTQQLYGTPPTTLKSTFNATEPPDSQGEWELAYDVWTNDYANDVMVWEDTSTSRLADNGAVIDNPNVTIDGVSYTLMHYGTEAQPERMLVRNTPVTSGSEDITDDLNYLVSIGDLPAGDGINQSDFGWEVCSTVGTQTFTLNSYTLTSSS